MMKTAAMVLFVLFQMFAAGFEVAAATDDELKVLGVVSVKTFGAIGDGTHDDTAAIQKGIDTAKAADQMLLFPEGVYLVSSTLKCYRANVDNSQGKAVFLRGSTKGARPIIKLKDNTAPFNRNIDVVNADANSTPVAYVTAFKDANRNGVWDFEDLNGNGVPESRGEGELGDAGNGFSMRFVGIDFDLGRHNTSAMAVRTNTAQYGALQDIRVVADGGTPDDPTDDAFGGFNNITGSYSCTGNLEVVGGRVGIIARSQHCASINGARLINQSDYALFRVAGIPITLVGFEIQKKSAPAIGFSGNTKRSHDLALIDGRIEFASSNDSPAVDNSHQNNLFVHDVYVKNAKQLVKSGTFDSVNGDPGWNRIVEYGVADKNEGWNMIKPNGSEWELTRDQVFTSNPCSEDEVPADFIKRHVWNSTDFPSHDDHFDRANEDGNPYDADEYVVCGEKNGVLRRELGEDDIRKVWTGPDCRAGLQGLIDAGSKYILLPHGLHFINKNPQGDYGIQLGKETRLLGVMRSELRTHDDWNPETEMPLLTTPDDAEASSMVGFVHLSYLYAPTENDWFNGLLWRAGTRSILRNVEVRPAYVTGPKTTNNKANLKFSGNAGGRHYAVGAGTPCAHDGPGGFRRLLVTGTSNPLAFYNYNPEDGDDLPQSEVLNSRNVIFYGLKAENSNPIQFTDSSNCALIGFGANCDVTIKNSEDILIGVVCQRMGSANDTYPPLRDLTIKQKYPNGSTVGLFKRGNFNWEAVRMNFEDRLLAGPRSFYYK